jgi:hypothetical protein
LFCPLFPCTALRLFALTFLFLRFGLCGSALGFCLFPTALLLFLVLTQLCLNNPQNLSQLCCRSSPDAHELAASGAVLSKINKQPIVRGIHAIHKADSLLIKIASSSHLVYILLQLSLVFQNLP